MKQANAASNVYSLQNNTGKPFYNYVPKTAAGKRSSLPLNSLQSQQADGEVLRQFKSKLLQQMQDDFTAENTPREALTLEEKAPQRKRKSYVAASYDR